VKFRADFYAKFLGLKPSVISLSCRSNAVPYYQLYIKKRRHTYVSRSRCLKLFIIINTNFDR